MGGFQLCTAEVSEGAAPGALEGDVATHGMRDDAPSFQVPLGFGASGVGGGAPLSKGAGTPALP